MHVNTNGHIQIYVRIYIYECVLSVASLQFQVCLTHCSLHKSNFTEQFLQTSSWNFRVSNKFEIYVYNKMIYVPDGLLGNGSTHYWPPGSSYTLGSNGHIKQKYWLFMWINIQACSFLRIWTKSSTESPLLSCKYCIFPLISTRVSGYSQVILLGMSH